jgi:pentapeptide repeat protein
MAVISYSAFVLSPREKWTIPWALDSVGIRTYADLREVGVAQRPEGWEGNDWSKVKRVDLHGRNLAFADATRIFLVNADLRGVILTGANFIARIGPMPSMRGSGSAAEGHRAGDRRCRMLDTFD